MTDVSLQLAASQSLEVDFRLLAILDGRLVEARHGSGTLIVDAELLERAKLLISLGEAFSVSECRRTIDAGLDEPVQAAVTLVRASDRVHDFRLTLDGVILTFTTEGKDERTARIR